MMNGFGDAMGSLLFRGLLIFGAVVLAIGLGMGALIGWLLT